MRHPETHPSSEAQRCADKGRLERFPCIRSAGHSGSHRDSLNVEWGGTCGQQRPGEIEGPGRRRLPCTLPAEHEGRHRNAFGDTWSGYLPIEPQREESTPLRRLGYDAATGKTAYALTEPGGILDTMADVTALEAATLWHALVGAVLEGPELSADEGAFLLARVVESLGEVLPIAARAVEVSPHFRNAGLDIGAFLRDAEWHSA